MRVNCRATTRSGTRVQAREKKCRPVAKTTAANNAPFDARIRYIHHVPIGPPIVASILGSRCIARTLGRELISTPRADFSRGERSLAESLAHTRSISVLAHVRLAAAQQRSAIERREALFIYPCAETGCAQAFPVAEAAHARVALNRVVHRVRSFICNGALGYYARTLALGWDRRWNREDCVDFRCALLLDFSISRGDRGSRKVLMTLP